MKAIEYLKRLDRAAEIYGHRSHTECNFGMFEAYMDGITDMAINDPDITGRDFDEVITTKREYLKDFKEIVNVFKEEYDEGKSI